jgi:hypothetical protein
MLHERHTRVFSGALIACCLLVRAVALSCLSNRENSGNLKNPTKKKRKLKKGGVMKSLFNMAVICVFSFTMTGCAAVMGDLPTISAGYTGCPPNLITIQDENMGYFSDTWTAKCQGRVYYCSRQVRGSTVCTEASR